MYKVLIALVFLLPGGVVAAQEAIPSFDARIVVYEDASIEVAERIVYDFGEEERHGIFRVIPYSYQAGTETYTADVSMVAVHDDLGTPLRFTESRDNGELTLKIGDPDVTITGMHTYVVTYRVHAPFLYFDDFDEFYWNVTGSWPNPIVRASVLVDLPSDATVLDAACYQGARKTTEPCDEDQRLVRADGAGYTAAANNLAPREGFTIAVSFPKGAIAVVEKPWAGENRTSSYAYLPLGVPIFVLFFMLYWWYTYGRDPAGRRTIVTEFAPPEDVSPALAGIVYNERIEPREISAEIVQLAVDGFIKIHRTEKEVLIFTSTDYLLERIGKETPKDPVAALILEKLFQNEFMTTENIAGKNVTGTLVSKMRQKFVAERDSIIDALYQSVLDDGYFPERPDVVRKRYTAIGVVVAIAGVAAAVIAPGGVFTVFGVAAAFSGILVGIFAMWMPSKTRRGVLLKEHLEGFKQYLSVAEKDRLAFHNAPEKTPALFDKYLPYAMAFDVEDAWAEQFEDIYTEEPTWHTGSDGDFSSAAFAHSMQAFSTDFSAASAPASSGSSGGGSVGGGFGGGGGGSW
jgi:uncharacterized membrane protein YgcG